MINGSSLYLVFGNETFLSIFEVGTSIAKCKTGDVVIEGGFEITFGGVRLLAEGPLPTSGLNVPDYTGRNNSAYFTTMQDQAGGSSSFQAYAYCFDNPPLG